jgi:hypothetical protein
VKYTNIGKKKKKKKKDKNGVWEKVRAKTAPDRRKHRDTWELGPEKLQESLQIGKEHFYYLPHYFEDIYKFGILLMDSFPSFSLYYPSLFAVANPFDAHVKTVWMAYWFRLIIFFRGIFFIFLIKIILNYFVFLVIYLCKRKKFKKMLSNKSHYLCDMIFPVSVLFLYYYWLYFWQIEIKLRGAG